MRFSEGDELYCSAPCTQWWLVMTSPSGDTNDAEHPPSETTAERVSLVGSASCAGSIWRPSSLSFAACAVIWLGIHMPPGFSKDGCAADAVEAAGVAKASDTGGGTWGGGRGCSPPQAKSRSDDSGARARARGLMAGARSTGGGGRANARDWPRGLTRGRVHPDDGSRAPERRTTVRNATRGRGRRDARAIGRAAA